MHNPRLKKQPCPQCIHHTNISAPSHISSRQYQAAPHCGSAEGPSKPWMHGKNLSPGLRGEQQLEKSGALSEPSIMQKGVRW
mmetsp:Transcript_33561/g.83814  ORF Transcript_33561/g.83814 Transcript_33561/m.83814 type:complete len:82 (+) Transcript_33561:318-563(+)